MKINSFLTVKDLKEMGFGNRVTTSISGSVFLNSVSLSISQSGIFFLIKSLSVFSGINSLLVYIRIEILHPSIMP